MKLRTALKNAKKDVSFKTVNIFKLQDIIELTAQ